ncbi:hypothetical protein STEG23_020342 [Scotinomys teguina]
METMASQRNEEAECDPCTKFIYITLTSGTLSSSAKFEKYMLSPCHPPHIEGSLQWKQMLSPELARASSVMKGHETQKQKESSST